MKNQREQKGLENCDKSAAFGINGANYYGDLSENVRVPSSYMSLLTDFS